MDDCNISLDAAKGERNRRWRLLRLKGHRISFSIGAVLRSNQISRALNYFPPIIPTSVHPATPFPRVFIYSDDAIASIIRKSTF